MPYNLNPSPVTVAGVTYPPAVVPGGRLRPARHRHQPHREPDLEQADAAAQQSAGRRHLQHPGIPRHASATPLTSNNYVARIDHDFSDKWHLYVTYRDFKLVNLTSNQVDIGGVLPGDTFGIPDGHGAAAAAAFRSGPAGLTTTITPTTTNTFVFSYLRQFWQWGERQRSAAASRLGRRAGNRRRKHQRPDSLQREHAKRAPALLGRPG